MDQCAEPIPVGQELLAHEEGDGTVAARADLPSHRRRGTEEGPKPSAPSSRCPRLEPYDKRLSRTVLRGLGGRKAPRLPIASAPGSLTARNCAGDWCRFRRGWGGSC